MLARPERCRNRSTKERIECVEGLTRRRQVLLELRQEGVGLLCEVPRGLQDQRERLPSLEGFALAEAKGEQNEMMRRRRSTGGQEVEQEEEEEEQQQQQQLQRKGAQQKGYIRVIQGFRKKLTRKARTSALCGASSRTREPPSTL